MNTPPAKPVVWRATFAGKVARVMAQTWSVARELACVRLRCEPGEVGVAVLEQRKAKRKAT